MIFQKKHYNLQINIILIEINLKNQIYYFINLKVDKIFFKIIILG